MKLLENPQIPRSEAEFVCQIQDFDVNLSKNYFPGIPPEQITRANLLKAVHSETMKRNAPIFLDCTHFSKKNWDEIRAQFNNKKNVASKSLSEALIKTNNALSKT